MRAIAPVTVSAVLLAAAALVASAPAAAEPASTLVKATLGARSKRARPAKATAKPTPPPQEEEKAAAATSDSGPAGAPTGDIAVGRRGPTRIDFDDRLIQGQTNKSGAVYLFDRKELSVRSMVRQRTSFRDQIVKDILAE